MSIETYTPKQILNEIIPAKYGKLEGEIMFIFNGHVLDGSVVAITHKDDILMTCRMRFTNDVLLNDSKEFMCLVCKLSHLVFVKPPTVEQPKVETVIEESKVSEVLEDNVPVSKPTSSRGGKGAGRGRGARK